MAATPPLLSYQFGVEVTGAVPMLFAYFTEVSGLAEENDVTEFRYSDFLGNPQYLAIPGLKKFPEITLKRGITGDLSFWLWFRLIQDGLLGNVFLARSVVTITMYDKMGIPNTGWVLNNAWPSKLSGPQLRTDSNDYGVEEVVLRYEGILRW